MKAGRVGPFSASSVSSPERGWSLLDKLHLGLSCHRFPQSPSCEEQIMPHPSHVFPVAPSAYALKRFDHAVRLAVGTEHSRRRIKRGGHALSTEHVEHALHMAWSEFAAYTSTCEYLYEYTNMKRWRFDTWPYPERSLYVTHILMRHDYLPRTRLCCLLL